MGRIGPTLSALMILVPAFAGAAFAQSSGNFAADIDTRQCVLSSSDGSLADGATRNVLTTTIKTPNANTTALVIRPSLVTGLYTNTFIDPAQPMTSETARVVVKVLFDGMPVPPETSDHPSVTYDARFQEISTNMFAVITECANGNPLCNFDLILSTLSAHSYDFVVPDPGVGTHTVEVSWSMECARDGVPTPCANTFTANSAAACVGPGVLTVTQVKAFNQSGGITVQ